MQQERQDSVMQLTKPDWFLSAVKAAVRTCRHGMKPLNEHAMRLNGVIEALATVCNHALHRFSLILQA